MPIPKATFKVQLERQKTPIGDRILTFLRERPDQAFTAVEILAEVEGVSVDSARLELLIDRFDSRRSGHTSHPFSQALDALAERNLLDFATVNSETYYSSKGN